MLRFALTFLAIVLATPAPAGTIDTLAVPSIALERSIPVTVYRPDGPPPDGGWPVLYLLHGLGGDEKSWLTLGRIRDTLDRLIDDGTIRPLLVVMPGVGNSWYVNSRPIAGPGDYENAIAVDLPTFIENRYPASSGRAIAGLSMGGYGALRIGLSYPRRYAAIASLSGALWQNVPKADLDKPPNELDLISQSKWFHRIDPATIVSDVDVPPPGTHFATAFGDPFDARFFNRMNVFTAVAKTMRDGSPIPPVYLTVGDRDDHGLWKGTFALFETMRAENGPATLRVTGGTHSWDLWRSSIKDALSFVDRNFTMEATGQAR